MTHKVWLVLVFEFLLFALILFGTAGTFAWPEAWIYLALIFSAGIAIVVMLLGHDRALLDERMKPIVQPGQPLWDKILLVVFVLLFLAWMVLMPLDVMRFGWSQLPLWVEGAGGFGVAISMVLSYRVMHANTFLSPVVKIQQARGQKVIHNGPYAIIRHPLYSAGMLYFVSTAMLLGSAWGVIASAILILCLVIRTMLEDRELTRSLTGYADYAYHVRYRLIPYLW
jgi:protein-S-isoprenylcysteine O-methyltransferase Ste14